MDGCEEKRCFRPSRRRRCRCARKPVMTGRSPAVLTLSSLVLFPILLLSGTSLHSVLYDAIAPTTVQASPLHPVTYAARHAFRQHAVRNAPLYRGLPGAAGRPTYGWSCRSAQCSRRSTRLQFWEHFFPVLDAIEPLETVWEWYVKRDEVMDGLIDSGIGFLRRKSVQVVGLLAVSLCIAEALTWTGVIHPRKEMEEHATRARQRQRQHFWHVFRKPPSSTIKPSQSREWIGEAVEEKVFKRVGSFVIDTGMNGFRVVRHWNPKSKFALAMTIGTFTSQTIVRVAATAVRVSIVAFVTLETLSFLGIIGERGESLLSWIDDRDDTEGWKTMVRRYRALCCSRLSPGGLLELYEHSVDEEKIATFGFALGSVIGIWI